jgi:hypothetical protein
MLESTTSTFLGLLGLYCAVARRCMGMQRGEQPMRRRGDLFDRPVEGGLIGL